MNYFQHFFVLIIPEVWLMACLELILLIFFLLIFFHQRHSFLVVAQTIIIIIIKKIDHYYRIKCKIQFFLHSIIHCIHHLVSPSFTINFLFLVSFVLDLTFLSSFNFWKTFGGAYILYHQKVH